jgi:flagellar protein FliO/FliZ
MLELTVRLVASLAVVVGLLLLLARVVGKRFEGRPGAAVQVLHRQSLSRSASIAVLSVGSRILVVGTTEQQVQLLTELDPEELELDVHDAEVAQLTGLPAPAATTALIELDTAAAASTTEPVRRAGAHRAGVERGARRADRGRPAAQGSLAGSVLSPETWRQAVAAATGKAS